MCSTCTAGTYSNSSGASVCSTCSAGKYANITYGATNCFTCGAGSYSLAGATVCSTCSSTYGQYQPFAGQSSCSSCSGYTYYNGTSCAISIGSLVNDTQSVVTATESSITLYWTPPSLTTSYYYEVQITATSSTGTTGNWPLITVQSNNFTFFGLLSSTTYTCVILTIPTGGVLAGPGTSYSTYSFTTTTHIPVISSVVATPSTYGNFSRGASITVTFDSATNSKNTSSLSYTWTKSINGGNGLACLFSPSTSNIVWSGVWLNAWTYYMNVTSIASVLASAPSIGVTSVICPFIKSSDGLSLSSNVTSPPLSGTWSSRSSLPTLSAYNGISTSLISVGSVNNSLSSMIVVNQPLLSDRVTSNKLFQLSITIVEGNGQLTISDSAARLILGGSVAYISSGLQITATPYTINKLISFIGYTPQLGYIGRVSILSVLTTSAGVTQDTLVVYYNVIPSNTAPTITVTSTKASIEANVWSSSLLSSMFGITIADVDTLISTFGSRPMRLLVIASPRGSLSTYGSVAAITTAQASGDLTVSSARIEVVGTLSVLQSILSSIRVKYSLRSDGVIDRSDYINVIIDDLGNGAAAGLTGPSSSLFATKTLALSLTTINATSPNVLTAVLEGGLSTISVTFDSSLFIGPTLTCSSYITNNITTLFGISPSPTCVMTTTTTMMITLGNHATIMPGDTITFQNFAVGSDSLSVMSQQTITLTASAEALTTAPSVRLIGPSNIAWCDTLTVRASAIWLGGRYGTFAWRLDSPTGFAFQTNTGFSSMLNGSVSANFAAGATHVVYCTVTNFMNVSSVASMTFTVASNAAVALPSLLSVGGITQQVAYNTDLSLRALLRSSTCFDLTTQTTAPVCVWMGLNQQTGLQTGVNGVSLAWLGNGTALTLATSSYFSPGYSYYISVFCVYSSTVGISMTYNITVAPKQAPIAIITGGTSRTICSTSSVTSTATAALILDGTLSNDPSTPSSTYASLTYTWSCRTAIGSLPCLNIQSPLLSTITLASTSTITISGATLLADNYIFGLTVTTSDGRSAVAREQLITIIPCDVITTPQAVISITLPSKLTPNWFASSDTIAVSPQSSISLTGTVAAPFVNSLTLSFVWTIVGGEINTAASSSLTSFNVRDLVINPQPVTGANYLTPGASYRLTLTVTDSSIGYSSSSTITLSASLPPAPFTSLSLNLNSTTVLSQLQADACGFESRSPPSLIGVIGSGVSSGVNGQQLSYRYFYYDTNGRTISVAFVTPDTSLAFTDLPPGNSLDNGVLTVGVRVTDGYGNIAIITKPVYMLASTYTTSPAVLSVLNAGLLSASSSSAQELLALVQGVASVVSSLPANYTVVRTQPEQAARLTILSQSISAISSAISLASSTSSSDTSLVLDTLRTVTGSINLQLVSDDTTRASLLTVLASLSTQVVATLDPTVIAQYIVNLRNMLSMTLVYTQVLITPIVNRRLLTIDEAVTAPYTPSAANVATNGVMGRRLLTTSATGTVRDSIDNIYTQLYATLLSMSTSLITAEGESHAFEQSGLSVIITRTRLPLLTLPSISFNETIVLGTTTDVDYTQTVTGWINSWPSSYTFQGNNAAGTTWLVDVSLIAAYPNPYGNCQTVLLLLSYIYIYTYANTPLTFTVCPT
jgi:hypothetical protein